MAKPSSKTKLRNKHQNKQSKGKNKKRKTKPARKSQPVTIEKENFEADDGTIDYMDQIIDESWMGSSSVRGSISENGENPAKRKKNEDDKENTYENMPRTLNSSYPDEDGKGSGFISLLPIKNKEGLIQRKRIAVDDACNSETDKVVEENIEEDVTQELTMIEIYKERERKINECKSLIATLCEEILQNPDANISNNLKKLLDFSSKEELVVIRRLAIVSLCEIFKDIVPGYRIKTLTEQQKLARVSKDIKKLRDFEEALVNNYSAYLNMLDELVQGFVKKKTNKRSLDSAGKASAKISKSLAITATNCMAELLTALCHFNFRSNMIVTIVSNLNLDGDKKEIADLCYDAVKELFKNDKTGEVSLEAVKVIGRMAKNKLLNLRPQVLEVLLYLNINSHIVKEAENNKAKIEKIKRKQEGLKKLSKKEKKRKKLETRLNQELQETEAVESRQKMQHYQTDILKFIFVMYFRVLKQEQRTPLLTSVLKGLSKYAHLISVDFFHDLMMSLQKLINSGELTMNESFNCVLTALKILSGQGEALNIDPHHFYLHLYNLLVDIGSDCSQDDFDLCEECLDAMLVKRRKQVSLRRILGFLKRIATVSLQLDSEKLFSFMALMRGVLQLNQKCDLLLDNDSIGRGVFQPELADPEHCNAESTALWELSLISKHYSMDALDYAKHLLHAAPSNGPGALSVRLVQRKNMDVVEDAELEIYFPSNIPSSIPAGKAKKKPETLHDKWNNISFEQYSDVLNSSVVEGDLDFGEVWKYFTC